MLQVIRSMRELSFGRLMQVYGESYDVVAEQEFYQYLQECFFRIPGAMYCLWLENGDCLSALRLEPWKDGLLLTALETAPDCRNRGYGCALLRSVQTFLREQGGVKLYAHIHKGNDPSIHVHEKCGFRKVFDHAVYLDGSVDANACTYRYTDE